MLRNEELFYNLNENSHDFIVVCSTDNTVVWVNGAVRALAGHPITTMGELFVRLHPLDSTVVNNAWAQLCQHSHETHALQLRLYTDQTTAIYIEASMQMVDSSGEKYACFIGRDITAFMHKQHETMKAQDQLRHADTIQALGQLAGGIAHDFNNQLTGIVGYTDLIQSKIIADTHLYSYTQKILTITEHLGDVITKLLAFARKGKYQSVPLNINDSIKESIALLIHTVSSKITIHKELTSEPA
ncbi:MAG: PAS domain S-box protein, partial [Chitinivibrionales bacterium]|nr:PAS domain S-box protein [Chitinivibrionales bacterium]